MLQEHVFALPSVQSHEYTYFVKELIELVQHLNAKSNLSGTMNVQSFLDIT